MPHGHNNKSLDSHGLCKGSRTFADAGGVSHFVSPWKCGQCKTYTVKTENRSAGHFRRCACSQELTKILRNCHELADDWIWLAGSGALFLDVAGIQGQDWFDGKSCTMLYMIMRLLLYVNLHNSTYIILRIGSKPNLIFAFIFCFIFFVSFPSCGFLKCRESGSQWARFHPVSLTIVTMVTMVVVVRQVPMCHLQALPIWLIEGRRQRHSEALYSTCRAQNCPDWENICSSGRLWPFYIV